MKSKKFTTIDLLRHGECEGGEIYRGHTDVLLTDHGRQQMEQSLEIIGHPRPWNRIVSSPLRRCLYFSRQLAGEIGIPCEAEERFKEMHFGEWDGMAIEQVWQDYRELAQQFMRNPAQVSPPQGESLTDLQERVAAGWNELIDRFRGEHLLCVQHGGTIRVIMAQVLNMPLNAVARLHTPYANLCRVRIYHEESGDYPVLVFHNPAEAAG